MKRSLRAFIVFIALSVLISCGTSQPRYDVMEDPLKSAEEIASELKEQFMDLDAVKELRSASLDGAEFVHEIFDKAGKSIPRTTGDLAKHGRRVKRGDTRMGDLVFFKTGFFKKHVGVYIGLNRFVHSTADEGVLVSNIKDPYWKKKYWQTRRILEF